MVPVTERHRESISLKKTHYTLKYRIKPHSIKGIMEDRQLIVLKKKKMTTYNIYKVSSHPLEVLYMLYIFQSTHKLPVWQAEKIGIHIGKVMKKKTNHKGEQELFTFNNSVAFNTSIYIHNSLYMYRLRWDPSEAYSKHERKIQKPLDNSLDKCLQVAELSSFTKQILHPD